MVAMFRLNLAALKPFKPVTFQLRKRLAKFHVGFGRLDIPLLHFLNAEFLNQVADERTSHVIGMHSRKDASWPRSTQLNQAGQPGF